MSGSYSHPLLGWLQGPPAPPGGVCPRWGIPAYLESAGLVLTKLVKPVVYFAGEDTVGMMIYPAGDIATGAV